MPGHEHCPKGEIDVLSVGFTPPIGEPWGTIITLRNLKVETHFNFTFQLQPLVLHKKSGFITGWNPTLGNMFIRFFQGIIFIASDMEK